MILRLRSPVEESAPRLPEPGIRSGSDQARSRLFEDGLRHRAILGSFVFFFALGYGAIRLRPLFERPLAWRVLETLIALVMWLIAFKMLVGT